MNHSEYKLRPYQLVAIEAFTRSMANLPVGHPMRTTGIVSLSPKSSPLWISHRRP